MKVKISTHKSYLSTLLRLNKTVVNVNISNYKSYMLTLLNLVLCMAQLLYRSNLWTASWSNIICIDLNSLNYHLKGSKYLQQTPVLE